MSNQHPQSRKLKELLKKHQQIRQEAFDDIDDDYEPPKFFINSHSLYQEAHAKITAEQDIKLVREIALDYIDSICSTLPDNVATEISRQMNGF
jgi:2-C-methyl-D-erythritol 4-phosphate cytidylyltransferase